MASAVPKSTDLAYSSGVEPAMLGAPAIVRDRTVAAHAAVTRALGSLARRRDQRLITRGMATTQATIAKMMAAKINPLDEPPSLGVMSTGLRGVVVPVGPSFSGRGRWLAETDVGVGWLSAVPVPGVPFPSCWAAASPVCSSAPGAPRPGVGSNRIQP